MNIVFSSNSNYVKYLYVVLNSLLETNKNSELHIYVLTTDMTTKDIDTLRKLSDSYGRELDVLYVDSSYFANMGTNERISIESYFRLLIPWLLPEEDKALYLDVDMVINRPLDSFYGIDISLYACAACKRVYYPQGSVRDIISYGSMHLAQARRSRQESPAQLENADNVEFVAAPLLMNLEWFRRNISIEDYGRAADELGGVLPECDQSILNYLLSGNTLYLDDRYSVMPCLTGRFPIIRQQINDRWELEKTRNEAYIVHFAGYNPWRAGILTEHYTLWWEYAVKSPYFVEIMKALMDYTGYDFDETEYVEALETVYSPYKSSHKFREYFVNHNMYRISLYPAGTMSELLMQELGMMTEKFNFEADQSDMNNNKLECSDGITIENIFDAGASAENVITMNGITVKSPEYIKDANETDVLVITAWYYYKNIYEAIKDKLDIPVISLLDLTGYDAQGR